MPILFDFHKRIDLKVAPNDTYSVEYGADLLIPYNDMATKRRIAGKVMPAQLIMDHGVVKVQLYYTDLDTFWLPMEPIEAGVLKDEKGWYARDWKVVS